MNRSLAAAVLFLSLPILAVPASAAGGIGLMAAYWDTDEADSQVMPGGKVELAFGASAVDFELRLTRFDDLGETSGAVPVRLEATPIEVGLAWNFARDGAVNPYLGGGVGFYLLDVERRGPDPDADIDDEAGWYGVVGFEAPVHPRWRIFGEALYRAVKGERLGLGLDDFDRESIDLSGPAANLGVMMSW